MRGKREELRRCKRRWEERGPGRVEGDKRRTEKGEK